MRPWSATGWTADNRGRPQRQGLARQPFRSAARHDELPQRGDRPLPGRDLLRPRPAVCFFDVEQVFTHLRAHVDHLAASGSSPAQVRDAGARGRDGFRCADLEAAIAAERARGRRPRAFYVVPDHSNPAGTTMVVGTRHELLELASRHDILILEDSPYRMVSPGRTCRR